MGDRATAAPCPLEVRSPILRKRLVPGSFDFETVVVTESFKDSAECGSIRRHGNTAEMVAGLRVLRADDS